MRGRSGCFLYSSEGAVQTALGSDVVIWAPGVAVEVSLLVGKPLPGVACGVSNIPQMAACF